MSVQVSLSDFIKMVNHHLERELHVSLNTFLDISPEDYYKENMTVKEAKEACLKIQEDCLKRV